MTKKGTGGLPHALALFYSLNPEERKSPLLLAKTQGMCEEGKKLFMECCDDPLVNLEFAKHYDFRKGNCSECREAFLSYLVLLVNLSS